MHGESGAVRLGRRLDRLTIDFCAPYTAHRHASSYSNFRFGVPDLRGRANG